MEAKDGCPDVAVGTLVGTAVGVGVADAQPAAISATDAANNKRHVRNVRFMVCVRGIRLGLDGKAQYITNSGKHPERSRRGVCQAGNHAAGGARGMYSRSTVAIIGERRRHVNQRAQRVALR